MKLYFGNTTTTITTLMILCLLGFIGYTIFQRANILYWGRRTLFVLVFGLIIYCFAAARDGLDKTIQHTIDGSCAPGIFPLLSIPNLIGCIGAAIIIIAAIATPIAKSQAAREVWCYFMSGGALLKIVGMEVSRIRLLFFFEISVNSVERLCVLWAFSLVECVAIWALKLPVLHTDALKTHKSQSLSTEFIGISEKNNRIL